LAGGSTTVNTPASSINSIIHALSAIASGTMYGHEPAPPLGVITAVAGAAILLTAPMALLVNLRYRAHDAARTAYLTFWAAADALVVVAFVVLGYGGPPLMGHYLVPCLFSAVATFPLLFTVRFRTAAGAIAAVAVLASAVGVLTVPAGIYGGADAQVTARILSVIRAQGLSRGYAGYWLSHPITWRSDETVHVYPVQQTRCDAGRICPYELASATWYQPVAGRTFLVVTPNDACVRIPPPSLGAPLRTIPVTGGATVLVFGHDIAADFGHERPSWDAPCP
ncbi:MAG: hypothetical protein JOZ75_08830, partial [Candidatus Dormibacteraeota bacterium]|nr:hypothetical protein [Candidatus Dormibacteraeota bacterium]